MNDTRSEPGRPRFIPEWLRGEPAAAPSTRVTADLFLRALGLVYLIAFASLWVQVAGLIGSGGILPVADYLTRAHAALGTDAYLRLPTLLWLSGSDLALNLLCGGGVLFAVLLLLGLLPALSLALLWLFYLSLAVGGQVFLSFQWDVLLLEAGFLALFLAPLNLRTRFGRGPEPSRLALFLLKLLLFRLMFTSGVVKLTSGDASWLTGVALRFHYETQPLPTPLAFWTHHLPLWVQKLSLYFTFFVELFTPFFYFAPRRLRLGAAGFTALLMLLIALTGNYGFFNLLTVVLCIPLLDDRVLGWFRPSSVPQRTPKCWPYPVVAAVAAIVIAFTPLLVYSALRPSAAWPGFAYRAYGWLQPFRSLNSYGLFRVMTTKRPEIIIEGSDDGETWLPYAFKYKLGDVTREPPLVQPHMPRLDWQMWFAALGSCQSTPWFVQFLVRLLEGAPEATRLLEHNPFEQPPKFIRTTLYDYRYSAPATLREDGRWWQRTAFGPYCPVVSRCNGPSR
ncbi:lipase maturation factor family protein [soil metagenome]